MTMNNARNPKSQKFDVLNHVSGGLIIKFGREEILFSPDEVKSLALAMLKAVGCHVDFRPGSSPIRLIQ